MENYQATYINRDIAALFPKLNKIAYQRFLTMLSQLSSTIVNKSELARAIEISESTIREYLMIAEGSFFWRQLTSFENKITKSIVKMPKGYIRDSGATTLFIENPKYRITLFKCNGWTFI